ncbi:ThiF family adenylyltransferase [uncultured Bacteroides sp.]|uniref:ThiF family adenylyltransferase n=1 Tax=uncultured Bacteroides sp. TaxID=162156 RepID=UPI002AAABC71|nr:ThiF family adenylyltransferase [uncultured Bacteroides sp.]
MNNPRYSRNRLYVKSEEQSLIKDTKILLGGAGIGSIIAECALRFGFENITIIDGDRVELSNLNRQTYVQTDIGKNKAECLAKRLMDINPDASIVYHNSYADENNMEALIKRHEIAINALDFKSKIPFEFDEICKKYNIPVLHPYNFGWAGFLAVVKPNGIQLSQLSEEPRGFELRMAEYVSRYGEFWNIPNKWLEKVIEEYRNEDNILPPPQLSIASWITAGYCVNVMYNLITGKEIKFFPKFYLSSIFFDKS